jgi:hypothetical protein
VARVVGTEATAGVLNADDLEGLEHVGPVLAVTEPELGFFLLAQVLLKNQVVVFDKL